MCDYILSACSPADISAEHFERIGVKYLSFNYQLGGKDYKDDLGKTISYKDFYQAMRDGADTKTSLIGVDTYAEYFRSVLSEGKDVIHVSLSSGLSGSYNSARLAAEDVRAEYPDRKLYVVDSLAASSGFGLLVDAMADLKNGGMSIDELYSWANENKLKVHHWFFSTDLTFFVKGGRISKAAGWFGTILKICPLLNVDLNGKLVPREKIRGKSNVIKAIFNKMVENADNGKEYNGKCYISHSDCYDDAKAVADLVEKAFPQLNGKVLINNIGSTIGAHTGPGTVALFFFGKERIN
ncbi:MAG: DegV family protein [Clostridia bacterium]|nr:DegV family protein [Clostridia bacterium]